MASKLFLGTTCLFFLATLFAPKARGGAIFDVKRFGARGDGKTDDTHAVSKAWNAACASATPSTVVIPLGRFRVGPLMFRGQCKASPINFKLVGTLQAYPESSKYSAQGSWVSFQYIKGLVISGGGTFDGQGALAWSQNDCSKTGKCDKFPINVGFMRVDDSLINGVTSLNSKLFHMNVLGCNNVAFRNVKIIAPNESLNTDGIHIGRSTNITVSDSDIRTGDDCLSFGDGTQKVFVERVRCGPGHGISVGSLGKFLEEQPVKGIVIRNCSLTGTDNGVRIKTWPASPAAGVAEDMSFEDIVMNNVANPIVIDQYYCPHNQCKPKIPSRVGISNVVFKNIRGTSSTKSVMKISCSPAIPCRNVKISNVNLRYNGKDGPAISECANVKPILYGNIFPRACSKKATFP